MPSSPKARYVSITEAAEYLSISTKSVRRLIDAGKIKGSRIAGSRIIRVDVRDLDALLVPVNDTTTIAAG